MSFKAATKHVLTGFVLGSGLCISHYVVETRKQDDTKSILGRQKLKDSTRSQI